MRATALHRLFRPARAVGGAVLDLLYPPLCHGCGHRVATPHVPLCALCAVDLPRADDTLLHQRLHRHRAGLRIGHAFALWAFAQHASVQRLQHALKYGNRPRLGDTLGRWISSALPDALAARTHLVLPVPLARTRLLERGYNQSARLAAGIAGARGWAMSEAALIRTRPTQSQTRLSADARRANVTGAFAAHAPTVRARDVLLVDDVLTTGATVCACANAAFAAGAASVSVATLGLAGT